MQWHRKGPAPNSLSIELQNQLQKIAAAYTLWLNSPSDKFDIKNYITFSNNLVRSASKNNTVHRALILRILHHNCVCQTLAGPIGQSLSLWYMLSCGSHCTNHWNLIKLAFCAPAQIDTSQHHRRGVPFRPAQPQLGMHACWSDHILKLFFPKKLQNPSIPRSLKLGEWWFFLICSFLWRVVVPVLNS